MKAATHLDSSSLLRGVKVLRFCCERCSEEMNAMIVATELIGTAGVVNLVIFGFNWTCSPER